MLHANNCWHFNNSEHEKFHAQFGRAKKIFITSGPSANYVRVLIHIKAFVPDSAHIILVVSNVSSFLFQTK